MSDIKFLVINGPNLNMLGSREPEIYGSESLKQVENHTQTLLSKHHVQTEWYQSNIEGEIVTKIQELSKQTDYSGLVINPGAYSHTSVAILDAIKLLSIPVIEVHLTNTQKREEYRVRKITAVGASGVIEGFGKNSYYLAVLSQLI